MAVGQLTDAPDQSFLYVTVVLLMFQATVSIRLSLGGPTAIVLHSPNHERLVGNPQFPS